MSTGRAALFVLVVGCSSGKRADPPSAPCLQAPAIATGSGAGAVEGVEATVCFDQSCVRLDRDGKTIAAATPLSPLPPQVQQDRQVGGDRDALRDQAGQWTLKNTTTAQTVTVGRPRDRLDVVDTAVVAYQGSTIEVADPAALRVVGRFTLPGRIAAVMPWFDRIFVVLDHPAGTAQIDPKTATVYAGPPLRPCP
jgi:hypothetical protein